MEEDEIMNKKKFCIVTVYNSINSGSYWQAKALEIYLKNKDIDVYFYRRNNKSLKASSSKINQFLRRIKLLLNGNMKEIKKYNYSLKIFNKLCSDFKIIDNKSEVYDSIDCFILGSDTIWNVNDKFFYREYQTYFGGIFKGKNVISYAASVGNSSIEKILQLQNTKEYINNLSNISVRDNCTMDIIRQMCNKDIKLVSDPTLLLSKSDYERILLDANIKSNRQKYIFTYLFNDLSEKQIIVLKEYANKNGYRIISGTRNYKWCDECVVNHPLNFLDYINFAEYVITDTFHGTVFSINLRKQFSVIDRNKNKVNDFLSFINMNDRKENDISIDGFMKTINYDNLNTDLNQFIEESKKYLDDIIDSN